MAATMAGTAALTGAIGATVECAINDDWDSFAENFGEGYKISATVASVSSVVGAFAGVNVFPANCFTAGTPVVTANGFINIENIKTGDYVQSYNFDTNAVEEKRVVRTFENTTDTLVKVKVGSETIETTLEHPFYVLGKGWMQSGDLVVGDLLIDNSGNAKEMTSKLICHLSDSVKIYNFEVEDNHNYYVGENSVLVHNTCVAAAGKLAEEVVSGLTSSSKATMIKLGFIGGVGAGALAGGLVSGVGTSTVVQPTTVMSKTEDWSEETVATIQAEVDKAKKEGDDRIYYAFGKISTYKVVNIDLRVRYNLQEAIKMIQKGYVNFVTAYASDARLLVTAAFGPAALPLCHHNLEFPKTPHYHPGLVNKGEIIPNNEILEEFYKIKNRTLHSAYAVYNI